MPRRQHGDRVRAERRAGNCYLIDRSFDQEM